jgi:hypothetical protein
MVLNALTVAAECLFTPLVLDKESATCPLVSNLPYICLLSRASVVKVFTNSLFNVVVISLHNLASKSTCVSAHKVTFNLAITSVSGISGTKLKKASISSRVGWYKPAIISS